MELNDSLKTGVPWMDSQHREFISRIERLIAAMREGTSSVDISALFDFLGAYVLVHFGAEEAKMKDQDFQGLKSHVMEHEHFKYELDGLRKEFQRDGASGYLATQIKRRLLDWFVNHIGGIDQTLGGFLQEGA
jgi:hemerythrin